MPLWQRLGLLRLESLQPRRGTLAQLRHGCGGRQLHWRRRDRVAARDDGEQHLIGPWGAAVTTPASRTRRTRRRLCWSARAGRWLRLSHWGELCCGPHRALQLARARLSATDALGW